MAPPPSVSQSVANFLSAHGAINIENRRDVILCEMDVQHVEALFQTSLSYFRHNNGISLPSPLSFYSLVTILQERAS